MNHRSVTNVPKRAGHTVVAWVGSLVAASVLVGLGIATGRTAQSSGAPTTIALRASNDGGSSPTSTTKLSRATTMTPHATQHAAQEIGSGLRRSADGHLEPVAPGPAPQQTSGFLDTPNFGKDALSNSEEVLGQFDGRPVRVVRTVRMRVTAYSPDARSCGTSADGITASGHSVSTNGGCLVAADPKLLPLGSIVSVPGYDGGAIVPVLDVGGAIKGNRLDVLFPTHEAAMNWGVRDIDVDVWEYADGRPNGFQRVRRPAK